MSDHIRSSQAVKTARPSYGNGQKSEIVGRKFGGAGWVAHVGVAAAHAPVKMSFNGPVAASHNLLANNDFSWHNQAAEQRKDCRRYAGLSENFEVPPKEERPLLEGAAKEGKFKIVRSGLPYHNPSWTIPKDT